MQRGRRTNHEQQAPALFFPHTQIYPRRRRAGLSDHHRVRIHDAASRQKVQEEQFEVSVNPARVADDVQRLGRLDDGRRIVFEPADDGRRAQNVERFPEHLVAPAA